VTAVVVQGFEVDEINRRHQQMRVGAPAVQDHAQRVVLKCAAVEQTGQRIAIGAHRIPRQCSHQDTDGQRQGNIDLNHKP
jgi:hypothetical protein